jgi:hypothetical protein
MSRAPAVTPDVHLAMSKAASRLPQVGTLAFISSLVHALAWSAAAVILGLIFRRQVRAMFASLAERMKHLATLKAPWTELSFSDEVFSVRSELAEIVVPARTPDWPIVTIPTATPADPVSLDSPGVGGLAGQDAVRATSEPRTDVRDGLLSQLELPETVFVRARPAAAEAQVQAVEPR